MPKRIETYNKDDIVTGFDITEEINVEELLLGLAGEEVEEAYNDDYYHDGLEEIIDSFGENTRDTFDMAIDVAEEIFTEEASVSIWSGNMTDNAVCGVSGDFPDYDHNTKVVSIDVRIGVNEAAIMDTSNWDAHQNKFYGKSKVFTNPIVYTYNGFRMKPGVDYSQFLEEGTAKIPNASLWAGFVEKAEARFEQELD